MAIEYEQKVLRPKIAFLEDIVEIGSVVKCENNSYSVPKFKMVTIKVLKDMIICDDIKSSSILSALDFNKIKSVAPPH